MTFWPNIDFFIKQKIDFFLNGFPKRSLKCFQDKSNSKDVYFSPSKEGEGLIWLVGWWPPEQCYGGLITFFDKYVFI